MNEVEDRTGRLFGDLWHKLDDEQFEQSVKLFASRFEVNGFDLSWFEGKECLDVGCGGGRYSIAMGRLNAAQVVGCDVSDAGLADARMRAANMPNIRFEHASALELPYEDNSFDFVCCSGVLHHTTDPDKGLDELSRVLRSEGKLYLLLYGSGGLRWAASSALRPIAKELGCNVIDRAIQFAELPANNRAAIMDDFFVPIYELVDWTTLHKKLNKRGFMECQRWERGQFDHESNVEKQRDELDKLVKIFSNVRTMIGTEDEHLQLIAAKGLSLAEEFVSRIDGLVLLSNKGEISAKELEWEIIGESHHRVVARKCEV